jgi:hypothetical protein
MDAINNPNTHAANSIPDSEKQQSAVKDSSDCGVKITSKAGDEQQAALLSGVPKKNQATASQAIDQAKDPVNNSYSAVSTAPRYGKGAADGELRSLKGWGAGASMHIEVLMQPNPFYSGMSPLEVTQHFIRGRKIDINSPVTSDKRESCLEVAARLNQTDIVQWLIQQGASVNYRNADNKTALDVARENGSIESMRMLGLHGAELTNNDIKLIEEGRILEIATGNKVDELENDNNKATLLLLAVHDGAPLDVIRELLDKGADPERQDAYGRSAMSMAIQMNDPEVLELLRSRKS